MAEISVEEREKLLSEEQEEKQRYRALKGPARLYQKALGISIPIIGIVFILNLPLYFGISLFNQQFLGLFLGLLMALMFIILPPSPKSSRRSLPWYDLIFSLLSLFTGFYIFICYPDLISTIGVITPFRVFIGTIVISLVIEGTRRTSGWILVAVVLFFIVYFKFGYLFSGILEIQKISWEEWLHSCSWVQILFMVSLCVLQRS